MITVCKNPPQDGLPEESAQAIFHRQWQIYRTLIDNNYLFHHEVCDCLHRIIVDEVVQPFRFLDIACGDAETTIWALTGTQVAHYHGIDQSPAALDLAKAALATLGCPFTLEQRDFVKALVDQPQPADVVWIGLSLHHFQAPEKLAVMRAIRSVVGEHGLFLIYEPASPDGEDRNGWLGRWDDQRPTWTAYAAEEWETMTAHVHAADFPETVFGWHALGHEAGFGDVREIYVAPSDLFRMYCFRASARGRTPK